MAASDPATDVATPTGVLQGCAAFSYSGGTWAPAGAGPSVATPTGVLRGIAPFSYSGGWTPTGLAVPDVATPTGVLDGVAVYTWGGSSWAPPSGSSTPTGALRGVAGFQWDGSAWQPAGQAGPSVATPFGVLDGVALFNWSGSAWVAASAGPPGATLDLSFMSGTLPTGVTFTRASTATYVNAAGTMQTAAANAPRFDNDPATHASRGLLIEESRTNLALWSADCTQATWTKSRSSIGTTTTAPDGTATGNCIVEDTTAGVHGVNQLISKAASALTYTYSVYVKANQVPEVLLMMEGATSGNAQCFFFLTTGTLDGSPAVSGTWTNPSASIVNAGNGWYRCILTATSNTDTGIYCDVYLYHGGLSYTGDGVSSAYVWGAQLEQAAFPTSYIATSGASATRAADVATLASITGRNSAAESFVAEYEFFTAQETNSRIVGSATTTLAPLFANPGLQAATTDGVATLPSANSGTLGAITKAAATWTSPNAAKICLNAGAVATAATLTAGFAAVTSFKLMGDSAAADQSNGYIRRFRYWPRVLTNAEMQQATT